MTTIDQARFDLDRLILERLDADLPTSIEQIDVVLCEDNETCFAYVYFVGASVDDIAIVSFDLAGCPPNLFDHRAAAKKLLSRPGEAVH